MRNDKDLIPAAILAGVFFWACAVSSSPATETNGASNCASTNVAGTVATECAGKKAIYSRVLSVWWDAKTGELRSAQVEPVCPPLLSKK